MSAISDYTDKVNAAFDGISEHLDGLTADVAFLKDEITKLQTSPTLSDADKAALQTIVDRANAANDKAAAADALTSPPAPPTT